MNSYAPFLEWIDTQAAQMRQWVTDWANVNSGTGNISGIEKMIALLRAPLARLGGELLLIPMPPAKEIDARGEVTERALGNAISVIKRPEARVRVLLAIHVDT